MAGIQLGAPVGSGVKLKADEAPGGSNEWVTHSRLDGGTGATLRQILGDTEFGLDVDVTRMPVSTGAGGGKKTITVAAADIQNVLADAAGARKRAEVQNISTVDVWLNFGAVASATAFKKRLRPGDEWVTEAPYCFQGTISAWHAAPTAKDLAVAEFT